MKRTSRLNDMQVALLQRVAEGVSLSLIPPHQRTSLNALRDRGLLGKRDLKADSPGLVTDAGNYYLIHGVHPDAARSAISIDPTDGGAKGRKHPGGSVDQPKGPRPKSAKVKAPPKVKAAKSQPEPPSSLPDFVSAFHEYDLPKLLYSMNQAADATDLSTSTIGKAIKGQDGLPKLQAKTVGSRVVISAVALIAWIDSLPSA